MKKLLLIAILVFALAPLASADEVVYDKSIDITELPFHDNFKLDISANKGHSVTLETDSEWIELSQTEISFIDNETEQIIVYVSIPLTSSQKKNATIHVETDYDTEANFLLEFEITALAQYYDLTIYTQDLMTKSSIRNVTAIISREGEEQKIGKTNQDAEYIFSGIKNGCWDLILQADDYETKRTYVCLNQNLHWPISLINASLDINNMTDKERDFYDAYLREEQLRILRNIMEHQPNIIEREKIVYEEIPYSPEAFEQWMNTYNPLTLNITEMSLQECKISLNYLRETRLVELTTEVKELRAEVESKNANKKWLLTFGFGLPILSGIGLLAWFLIKKRMSGGYMS